MLRHSTVVCRGFFGGFSSRRRPAIPWKRSGLTQAVSVKEEDEGNAPERRAEKLRTGD